MINLVDMIRKYSSLGYTNRHAIARVCQDIVLMAIANSSFSKTITIKGGVVMRSLTNNVRRATEDLDIDFLRYPLDDDSIRDFISKLNCIDSIKIEIKNQRIEQLSQQEYNGKRIFVVISDDYGNVLESKIDIGVHANVQMNQEIYCFDVCLDNEGIYLLINSCEQIFVEKLKSLLRFGPLSTRYKDIFDLCYLKDYVEIIKLKEYIRMYITEDLAMREKDLDGIIERIVGTFANRWFKSNIENAEDRNWLEIDVEIAFSIIVDFLKSINTSSTDKT